jgi:hypothetical protein
MRFVHTTVVAVLALIATCDAVAGDNSKTLNDDKSVRGLDSEDKRSLRIQYEDVDPEDSGDAEERAFEEALEVEARATLANAKYRRWYKADLKPKQVKKLLGVKSNSMTETQRELQRLYLGYYSFYTARHRNDGSNE